MNGTAKTVAKIGGLGLGGVTLIGGLMLVTNVGKAMKAIEPMATIETNKRIDALRDRLDERTRGLASDGRIEELNEKILVLARTQDLKDIAMQKELLIMERRILKEQREAIHESSEHVIRQVVAAIKISQSGGGQ